MGIGEFVIVILLLVVTAANYLRFRDPLYPPVIQSGVWTVVLIAYFVNQEQFYSLSGLFYLVVVVGVLLFSLGGFLITRGVEPSREPIRDIPFARKEWYDGFLFWTAVLGILPFLLRAQSVAAGGPFDGFYQNLRLAVVTAEDPTAGGAFGIFAYLIPLSYAAVIIQTLLGDYKKRRLRYWTSVAVATTYTLLSTGRISILFVLLSVAGVLLMTRRWRVSRVVVLLPTVVVMLVIAVGIYFESEGVGLTAADTFSNVQELVLTYTMGSLPAFDEFMNSQFELQWGESTFRTFYAVLAHLGFDVNVRPNHFEFTNVPYSTNVYTLYRPYFADYAFAGAFSIAFLLGIGHGFVYKKAVKGNLFFIALFAITLFPLVLQFYQDRYFSTLSLWIQYFIIFGFYFYRFQLIPSLWSPSTSSS